MASPPQGQRGRDMHRAEGRVQGIKDKGKSYGVGGRCVSSECDGPARENHRVHPWNEDRRRHDSHSRRSPSPFSRPKIDLDNYSRPRSIDDKSPRHHRSERQRRRSRSRDSERPLPSHYDDKQSASRRPRQPVVKLEREDSSLPDLKMDVSTADDDKSLLTVVRPANLMGKAPQFDAALRTAPEHLMQFRSGVETDAHRLANREKQILFGKNTTGYDNYIAAVPKKNRRRIPEHPVTPDATIERSKRHFEGLVSAWRRQLHRWDSPDVRPDLEPRDSTVSVATGQKRKRDSETSCHPAKSLCAQVDAIAAAPVNTAEREPESDVNTERVLTIAEECLDDGYESEDIL